MRRLIVGITGASGALYGVRALEALRQAADTCVHLVISEHARRTLEIETPYSIDAVRALADEVHDAADVAAPISSGSFQTDGMLVIPCSIKSAAAIAYSLNDNLLIRAADVCLKERRRLVLVVRETPLHLGHLRTLTRLCEMGAIILPPIPGMYAHPRTVDDVVNHTVGKALDLLGVPNETFTRWKGGTRSNSGFHEEPDRR